MITQEEILKAIQQACATAAWPRWLPSKKAAQYSGLSEKTLRKLAKQGEIYAACPGGGKLLFDKEDIDAYMLRQKAQIADLLSKFTSRKRL